jgi:hypothetical protein
MSSALRLSPGNIINAISDIIFILNIREKTFFITKIGNHT